jgi:hypothetical protein
MFGESGPLFEHCYAMQREGEEIGDGIWIRPL